MPLYGYARVSTTDQDLSLQEVALRAAGCEVIRTEKKSGTSREGRTELAILLEFLRAGDTLMVTRVDRLARSIGDLQDVATPLALYASTLTLRPSTKACEPQARLQRWRSPPSCESSSSWPTRSCVMAARGRLNPLDQDGYSSVARPALWPRP